jgi:hypothetical protein
MTDQDRQRREPAQQIDVMDNHWGGPRGDRCRAAEAVRRLKEEYDRDVQRLKEEDPDWVKELLARLK